MAVGSGGKEELIRFRAHVHSVVDRAFDSLREEDSDRIAFKERAGVRVLDPLPGSNAIRRELTGKHSLVLTWKETPDG